MMNPLSLTPIGQIRVQGENASLVLDGRYAPALLGLEGFSHIQILWWFDGFDTPESRAVLDAESPYKKGPGKLGIFATRSPIRPNPIALSTARVLHIDHQAARIGIDYADARDASPLLDIKPYTPSLDRVHAPQAPQWCAHWPDSLESSGSFDWEKEFNF